MKLFEISVGKQVLDFSDYLETRCPASPKKKPKLQEFASLLFKEGWTYSCGDSHGDFIKGNNDEGKFRIVMPEKHWNQKEHNRVRYYFFHERPTTQNYPGAQTSDYTDIDINNPLVMMEIVHRCMHHAPYVRT
jgi:hypothetical protein